MFQFFMYCIFILNESRQLSSIPIPEPELGSGIAKAELSDGKKIYLYRSLPFSSPPLPVDSLIIQKGQHHFEIKYAPSWFLPEMMKLDYDLLFLRTLTISRNWMEVVTNRQTGLTHWIAREDAEFIEWTNFILNVNSVELIDLAKNPLRLKPSEHAGILAVPPPRFQFQPLAIRGEWMMVSTLGISDRIPPEGWIRWRDANKLLVKYSLLS